VSSAADLLAVREIAERLARPATRLEALTARVLESPLLTQSLPLTDVSPFGVLRDAAVSPPDRAGGNDSAYRAELLRPLPTTRTVAPEASGGTSRASSPVFSFRRPPATRSTTGHGARSSSTAESDPGTRGESSRLASFPPDRLPGDPSMAIPEVAPMGSASEPPSSAPAGRSAPGAEPPTIELVDALASELLAAPRPERRSPDRVESTPIHPAARAVASPDPLAPRAPAGRDHDPLSAAERAEPIALAPGQTRGTATLLPEPAVPAASPAPAALAATPTRAAGHAVTTVTTTSAGFSLDAETLAALVNEVLAEQARRHGVDLT
jgi:hypothetical protein